MQWLNNLAIENVMYVFSETNAGDLSPSWNSLNNERVIGIKIIAIDQI